MRVGTSSLYSGIRQRIQQLASELKDLNEKVASGKKLNRPSDDPFAMVEAMKLKSTMVQFEQYGRNMKTANSWTSLSESVFSQCLDLVGRARELTVQMSSDTQNADTRLAAASEAGHLLDQAISLGNSQLAGRYIFSGYKTSTVPFSKTTTAGVETAQYHGDIHDFQVQIGKDETISAGRNGQTALMNSTLFDTLGQLKKALEDNDLAAIQGQLGNLTTAENYLNNQIADAGGRQNRLQVKQTVMDGLNGSLQERLSMAEDADLPGVIMELKSREVAYQAAMAAAARIHDLTLLNYMSG